MTTQKISNVHVHSIKRLASSVNGNPRFELFTSAGNYRTGVDYAIGYGIENLTNSRFADTYAIGDDAPPCDLILSGARGNVQSVERDGKKLA